MRSKVALGDRARKAALGDRARSAALGDRAQMRRALSHSIALRQRPRKLAIVRSANRAAAPLQGDRDSARELHRVEGHAGEPSRLESVEAARKPPAKRARLRRERELPGVAHVHT
jgi:hypothetical protein